MRTPALRLLLRPSEARSAAVLLPWTSFTVLTAVVLSGAALARLFWLQPDDGTGVYRMLALAVAAMLAVPVGTMSAASARLSARRRDERLATLRLLGVRSRDVRLLTVLESTGVALAGVLAGTLVHLAAVPLLALVPIRGDVSGLEATWLPWWGVLGTVAAVVVLSALGALAGLRAVLVTPLGVVARPDAPRLHGVRALVALAVTGVCVTVLQSVGQGWGLVGFAAAAMAAVLAVMGVLGLAGPFLLGRIARFRARRASTAEALLAARAVEDDPKGAWRQVSGAGLMAFLVVPVGSLLGYLDVIRRSDTVLDAATVQAFTDVRTMMLAALALAFLLVAWAVGVSQAAAVLDRRGLHVSLDRMGMPADRMHAARVRQTVMALRVAVLGGALAAGALAWWLVAIAAAFAPLFMAGILLVLLGSELLVRLAVRGTRPVLRDVLARPERAL